MLSNISLFLFYICFSYIKSIMVEADGLKQKYCFSKKMESGDTYNFNFVISSDNEEKLDVAFTDGSATILFESRETSDEKHSGLVKQAGIHTLCFYPLNNNNYHISFEYYTNEEKGHTLDLAHDKNLHAMKEEVAKIALMLEETESNLRFIIDRRSTHHHEVAKATYSISKLSYIKIFAISLISVLQIIFIQRFFSTSPKGKNTFGSYEMTLGI